MVGLNLHLAINVMQKDVAIKARIVYTLELNMEIITVNGSIASFLDYIQDCPIQVRNSIFPLPIFILELLFSKILLGMPFWFAARLWTCCNGNGRITYMLNSPNGGNFQKFTAHLTNKTTKRKGKILIIFKNLKAQASTLRPCLSLQKTLVDNQDTVTPLQAKFHSSIRSAIQLEALQLFMPLTLRETINRLLKHCTRTTNRTRGVFFALRITNYLCCLCLNTENSGTQRMSTDQNRFCLSQMYALACVNPQQRSYPERRA